MGPSKFPSNLGVCTKSSPKLWGFFPFFLGVLPRAGLASGAQSTGGERKIKIPKSKGFLARGCRMRPRCCEGRLVAIRAEREPARTALGAPNGFKPSAGGARAAGRLRPRFPAGTDRVWKKKSPKKRSEGSWAGGGGGKRCPCQRFDPINPSASKIRDEFHGIRAKEEQRPPELGIIPFYQRGHKQARGGAGSPGLQPEPRGRGRRQRVRAAI